MHRFIVATLACVVTCVAATAWAGKVDSWRQHTTADFEKGKAKDTVISDRAQIRLSRELRPFSDLEAAFVWDLVSDKDGNLYAATGEEGKIFKITADGKASLFFDSEEQHIFSLALAPDGSLYAGTAPNGLVLRITPDGKATTHFKTGKNYVWRLVLDPQNNLYAATGTKAEIFKIPPDGKGVSFYQAKQNHMLALALGKDGSLYAGCDGEGLVYRISPQGKAFVLYDSSQEEIRSLTVGDDGSLYVGTSSPTPLPPTRLPSSPTAPTSPAKASAAAGSAAPAAASGEAGTHTQTGTQPSTRPATDGPAAAQGSTPRLTPGVNAVYRITPDGAVRELFQDRLLVLSLANRDHSLLVGTGQSGQLGQLFEIGVAEKEKSEVARVDHGVILCMVQRSDGSVVFGTGDPGKLYSMGTAYASKGTFESQVFDSGMISRWGALRWQADTPEGTKVSLSVRSGNVKAPDDTWTDWSPEQLDPQTAQVTCPASRFLQFRGTLASARPEITPVLRGVVVRYMTMNQAPEVQKVEVPDVGEGDGASRTTKLKVKWEAKDPNNDELQYTLYFRKEGWKEWVKMAEKQTKKEYDWDIDSVPDGLYRVRLEATDRTDNAPENALTGSQESNLVIVDHTAPFVTAKSDDAKPGSAAFLMEATDALTRIVGASYCVDSGEWTKLFPVDQLFDSKSESFRFAPADVKPGSHLLMVRAVDAAGNTGSADLVFTVEAAK